MTRLIYMAHPVRGELDTDRARRWLYWCYSAFPDDVVIAPWILDVEILPLRDDVLEERELGLVRDEVVVRHCDAVLLVGGRISAGMQREADVARVVLDYTRMGDEPPGETSCR